MHNVATCVCVCIVFSYFEENRWPCSSHAFFAIATVFSCVSITLGACRDVCLPLPFGSLNATLYTRLHLIDKFAVHVSQLAPCVSEWVSECFFRFLLIIIFPTDFAVRMHSFFQLSSFYLIIQITYSRMHEETTAMTTTTTMMIVRKIKSRQRIMLACRIHCALCALLSRWTR